MRKAAPALSPAGRGFLGSIVPTGGDHAGPKPVRHVTPQVEQAAAGGRKKPFMGTARVEVAAEIRDAHGDLPVYMRPVHHSDDSLGAGRGADIAHREYQPGIRGDSAETQNARAGTDSGDEQISELARIARRQRDLHRPDRDAVSGLPHQPSTPSTGMFLIRGEDFVAFFQV